MPHTLSPSTNSIAADAIRVLAVGDCNTCGIVVPPIGNTILDKFCNRLEEAGYATCRQNLGYGMATSREGVELMRRCAKPADIVLVNYGLVDTWITSIPRIYIPYFPENPLRKKLRKLLKFVKRRLRNPRLRRWIPVGPVVPRDEYEQNIRTMIRIAHKNQPQATVLLWGSPPVQHDQARNSNLLRYDDCLVRIAQDTDSHFVSTIPVMRQLSEEKAYLDDVHLGEEATAAIAAQLFDKYRSRQFAVAG